MRRVPVVDTHAGDALRRQGFSEFSVQALSGATKATMSAWREEDRRFAVALSYVQQSMDLAARRLEPQASASFTVWG
jgi:hypothetical protein